MRQYQCFKQFDVEEETNEKGLKVVVHKDAEQDDIAQQSNISEKGKVVSIDESSGCQGDK
ncbi:hypothetical protein RND71_036787 [Anisodus tanguticus]|uniref:Uncharacterized protein n=1 Tax=Anisodus tanguticus TaxID=243964 RepID=A0AAE1R242_9SOLA|nr:hypothetical protein RND71_036787 [Anisodus tanguticus]